MKPYTLALIIILLPTTALAISEEPVELIRMTTEQVLGKLTQAPQIKTEPEQLKHLVEESIVPSIDFVRLSRLTLGKHWRTASTERHRALAVCAEHQRDEERSHQDATNTNGHPWKWPRRVV